LKYVTYLPLAFMRRTMRTNLRGNGVAADADFTDEVTGEVTARPMAANCPTTRIARANHSLLTRWGVL
jgi:hypothetical protein